MSEPTGPVPLALAALQRGRAAEAAEHLAPVVRAPELEDPELADVRARLCSLYAQALLESGDTSQAGIWVRKALRAATATGDTEGITEIRALQGRIVGAVADAEGARRREEERAAIAARPLDELLMGLDAPDAIAQVLVKKASAVAHQGGFDEASALFLRAIDVADDAGVLREQVFARLGLAATKPALADALVRQAHALAESADEFTLLATIAREAERLDVSLPVIEGPAGLQPQP